MSHPTKSFRELLSLPVIKAAPTDSALVIIDAQIEYAKGALKVTDVDSSAKVILSLLEKYREAGGKVVHVLHRTPEGAPLFTPGTDLAEEFEELRPNPTHSSSEPTIHKSHPGAFEQTTLHTTLQSWNLNKVVLVGYMAHVCVSTTAREAFQKGYEVVLVEDGIGDRDIPGVSGDEVKRVALAELGDVFGTVVRGVDVC